MLGRYVLVLSWVVVCGIQKLHTDVAGTRNLLLPYMSNKFVVRVTFEPNVMMA